MATRANSLTENVFVDKPYDKLPRPKPSLRFHQEIEKKELEQVGKALTKSHGRYQRHLKGYYELENELKGLREEVSALEAVTGGGAGQRL